jgi:hypothetical protein
MSGDIMDLTIDKIFDMQKSQSNLHEKYNSLCRELDPTKILGLPYCLFYEDQVWYHSSSKLNLTDLYDIITNDIGMTSVEKSDCTFATLLEERTNNVNFNAFDLPDANWNKFIKITLRLCPSTKVSILSDPFHLSSVKVDYWKDANEIKNYIDNVQAFQHMGINKPVKKNLNATIPK